MDVAALVMVSRSFRTERGYCEDGKRTKLSLQRRE